MSLISAAVRETPGIAGCGMIIRPAMRSGVASGLPAITEKLGTSVDTGAEGVPFTTWQLAQSRAENSWPLCRLLATPCAKHSVVARSIAAAANAIDVACFTSDPPIVRRDREGFRIHAPHGSLSVPDARIGSRTHLNRRAEPKAKSCRARCGSAGPSPVWRSSMVAMPWPEIARLVQTPWQVLQPRLRPPQRGAAGLMPCPPLWPLR